MCIILYYAKFVLQKYFNCLCMLVFIYVCCNCVLCVYQATYKIIEEIAMKRSQFKVGQSIEQKY